MDVQIKIDPLATAPYVEIHTAAVTPASTAMVQRISSEPAAVLLPGLRGEEVIPLYPAQLIRIYTEDAKVMADTDVGTVALKYRLYELSALLTDPSFLRISNSEMVNFKKVRSMNMSVSGTISILLSNGAKTYVSRRYVAKIKTFLGL